MSEASLTDKIRARITARGPLTVADYMALCLTDPEHGYYTRREPFGRGGDFITAPEVSQMFGEIIAMWCLTVWQSMGAPAPVMLAELGPGRGTLMADVLRAAKVRPEFLHALDLHLVEASPRLRDLQAERLDGVAEPTWHDDVATLPELPSIILANEFFDALPIRQFRFDAGRWQERCIGCDEAGELVWMQGDAPEGVFLPKTAPEGAIAERCAAAAAIVGSLAEHLAAFGGAALVIDYGYLGPAFGDTLQAVSRHGFADVLAVPGEQDITAHVDFSALKDAAERAGAGCTQAMPQGDFLKGLGIDLRAGMLKRSSPGHAGAVDAALDRLTSPRQMGELFKAMALLAPGLERPPPF